MMRIQPSGHGAVRCQPATVRVERHALRDAEDPRLRESPSGRVLAVRERAKRSAVDVVPDGYDAEARPMQKWRPADRRTGCDQVTVADWGVGDGQFEHPVEQDATTTGNGGG